MGRSDGNNQMLIALPQAVPEDHPARKDAQAALQTLSDLLKQSRPKDSQNPSVVQYWTEICGLELPSQ